MRMSRRMGLVSGVKLPSLYELWSDATIVKCSGASASTKTEWEDVPLGDVTTPLWVFVSCGDSFLIEKVYGTLESIIAWRDEETEEYSGGVNIYPDFNSPLSARTAAVDCWDYQTYGDGLYGYILATLRFPSYSEAVIDTVLGKTTYSFEASRYKSGTGTCYAPDENISDNPDEVYLQFGCSSSNGYFSATGGGSPTTALVSSGGRAYWRHYNSRYYFSTTGSSNTSTRAAGILKLSLG